MVQVLHQADISQFRMLSKQLAVLRENSPLLLIFGAVSAAVFVAGTSYTNIRHDVKFLEAKMFGELQERIRGDLREMRGELRGEIQGCIKKAQKASAQETVQLLFPKEYKGARRGATEDHD